MLQVPDELIEWDDYFGAFTHLIDVGLTEPPEEFLLTQQQDNPDVHMKRSRRKKIQLESQALWYTDYVGVNDKSIKVRLYD